MNENEKIKLAKDGLAIYGDILRYAKTGYDSITPEDLMLFRWYGLYVQKPKVGHFMMRIKVPSGDLSTAQLRTIGEVARRYGRGITDITTRQNFQFHWLTVEDLPEVFKLLDAAGITTSGACGDIARNVTGCPVAGVDPHEIFDARPYAQEIHDFFLNNLEFSNLPRKFKLSVSGCPEHCAQPEINCFAATGVRRTLPDGREEEGFQIRVGGGLSTRPYFAQRLNMFVPKDKLVSVAAAVAGLYRDFGDRENRKRNRIKFLVGDWGIEKFEAELRFRLDWNPEPASDWPEPRKAFRDHIGVHAQKQPGTFWVGAAVLSGRLSDAQVFEIAAVADELAAGNVRTTNQQNLIVPDVPEANVKEVVRRLEAVGLDVNASAFRRAAVACTGNEFCNLAITETKKLIIDIVEHIERTVPIEEPIRINLNGCPNSCGQHHIGDIGLQGCLVKRPGADTVEGYDISLGGRLGEGARFVRPIRRKVPATDVAPVIEHLLNNYLAEKFEEEDFSDFVDRHTDDELATLMQTEFAEGVEA